MNMMSNVEINVSHLVIGRVADKLSRNYILKRRVTNGLPTATGSYLGCGTGSKDLRGSARSRK